MNYKSLFSNTNAIIAFSILFVALRYITPFSKGRWAIFLLFGIFISFVILITASIYRLKIYFKLKQKRLLFPLIISSLALIVVFFRPVEKVIEKLKSPPILIAHCQHTMSNFSLKFREDYSFELNSGGFFYLNSYSGHYTLVKDTITLGFNDKIPPNLNNKLHINKTMILELNSDKKHSHLFNITLNKLE